MTVCRPTVPLDPPHPYFGSKAECADLIWDALGADVTNFVDPFCGSCAVLYARPCIGPVETVNDAWGFIVNFLRAVKQRPLATAKYADWPVSELDMHARHRWLLGMMSPDFVDRLKRDHKFCDPKVAGYWVWGQSIWIGSGWCIPGKSVKKIPHLAGQGPGDANQRPHYGRGIFRGQLPHLAGPGGERGGYPERGRGIFRGGLPEPPEALFAKQLPSLETWEQIPRLAGREGRALAGSGIFRSGLPELPADRTLARQALLSFDIGTALAILMGESTTAPSRRDVLVHYFRLLSARLERVRIVCGNYTRVLTPAVTYSHGMTGILLDMPYGKTAKRTTQLYGHDDLDLSAEVRAWAVANGDNPLLRIVLCGYEGEHDELVDKGWTAVAWKGRGGYTNQGSKKNDGKERLWLSPNCRRRDPQLTMF